MNKKDFLKVLKIIAFKDTSFDPDSWSSENPLWGHCAVATLLAQDYFGGEIIRGSLEENSKYRSAGSHYWNKLQEGEFDFTAEQYSDLNFNDLEKEIRSRDQILNHPETKERYRLLRGRFKEASEIIL